METNEAFLQSLEEDYDPAYFEKLKRDWEIMITEHLYANRPHFPKREDDESFESVDEAYFFLVGKYKKDFKKHLIENRFNWLKEEGYPTNSINIDKLCNYEFKTSW